MVLARDRFDDHPSLSPFVVALLTAKNPGDVDEILSELGQAVSTRYLPIGGAPATAWDDEGRPNGSANWNNRALVKLLSSADVALWERVRNGHDASIEFFQEENLFEGNPRNFAEAADEVAENTEHGRVYVISTNEGCRTATVVDENLGIPYDAFGQTIMAVGSQNKVRNRLVAGNLGIGGLQSLAFATFTVIVSRPKADRNQVAFTIAWKIEDPEIVGDKGASYVWLTDVEGNALIADARELEGQCVIPSGINNDNFEENIVKPILPNHGTVVRMIEFPVGSNTHTWLKIRELGFGVPLNTVIINGLTQQRKLTEDDEDIEDEPSLRTKRVFYQSGLRGKLNNWKIRVKRDSVVYQQPPAVLPIDRDNTYSIAIWVMKPFKSDKSRKPPVQTLIPSARSGIVVTVDGQVHATLHDKLLFEKAGLSYLLDSTFIEVNLDGLSYARRNDWILASREQLNRAATDYLREMVFNFIKDDENLHALNLKFRNERVLHSSEESGQDVVTKINRMLARPLSGPLRARYGGSGTIEVDEDGPGPRRQPPREPVPPPHIDLRDPPTWIKLRKATIEPGSQEWFSVTCNATEAYDSRIRIDIVDGKFLHPVIVDGKHTRKGLREGREAFLFGADEAAPLGAVAVARATLTLQDGSMLRSQDTAITVVQRSKEPRKKIIPTQPAINPLRTRPTEALWQNMKAADLVPEDVAFNLLPRGEAEYDCPINMEFGAFVSAVADLKSRRYSLKVIDQFENDFVISCIIQALTDIATDLHGWDDIAMHKHRQAAIAGQLFLRHVSLVESGHKAM